MWSKRGIAWRGARGRFVCGPMPLLDSWLEPLRAYPRGLVLVCVVLVLAAACWVVAKVAKWVFYAALAVFFVLTTIAIARWLWE